MAEPVTVTLELNWTYGISGRDGQTRYVGPGRVTLPLGEAVALGGSVATRVYNYKGKRYTNETLSEAPKELLQLLRQRGVKTPETMALPASVAALQDGVAALRDIDGVGEELASALQEAGYTSVEAVAGADPAELAEKVAGVGAKSAPRLVEAAKQAAA